MGRRRARLWALATAVLPWSAGAAPTDDAGRLQRIETMYDGYTLAFPSVKGITAAELKRRVEDGEPVVIVDVRPEVERKVSVLPGAMSQDAFEAQLSTLRDRPVVVYCTIGARSGKVAAEWQKRGLDVLNLEGSLLSWTHVGGELVDAEGRPTKQVHVYGRKWDLVAKGYEGVVTDSSGRVTAP